MRKFLNVCIAFFLLVVGIFFVLDNEDRLFQETAVFTQAKDDALYIGKEKIYMRGVNLDTVKPNNLPGDFAASKADFLRWIRDIGGMYCNVIKVKSIMPAGFYQALLEYNQTHKRPIYLVQGINISSSDMEGDSKESMSAIPKLLQQRMKDVVDVVHGNKTPIFSKNIKETYKADVSEYTLAYSIDSALDYSDVIFSEIMDKKINQTDQKYLRPSQDASQTEKVFAELGNTLVEYETRHYRIQRMLTYQTSRSDIIETLEMKKRNKKVNDKKRYIDLKHIQPTKNFKSGIYASYSLNIENNEEMRYKGGIKYQIKALKQYLPHIPIVISEYAAPTTKSGTQYADDKDNDIDEKEQAEQLITVNKELQETGVAGDFILEWQDAWYRTTWNVKDRMYQKRAKYWHNYLSYSQSYGLLSFDTTDKFFPDHSMKEWKNIKPISQKDGIDLKVASDEAYIYLALEGKDIKPESKIQIDFDVTPHSGVTKSKKFDETYEKPIDFVVEISGDKGKVYVQDYYNITLFNQNLQTIKINPRYKKSPNKDSFKEEEIKVRNQYYSRLDEKFIKEKYAPIGQLTKGNTNPKAKDFKSMADFDFNKNGLEVRIPWMMLNFYDPSTKQIIGDLYKNRSIRGEKINTIGIGASIKENGEDLRLKNKPYTLEGWTEATYTERKKASYYILKDYFKEEAEQ